jgi:hypothetical protein
LDEQWAASKGCQPVKRLNSKWPQGLDLLLKAFRCARQQKILQFFLDVIAASGNTFEQQVLFARRINTIEPRNIEAVLSTQFTGW